MIERDSQLVLLAGQVLWSLVKVEPLVLVMFLGEGDGDVGGGSGGCVVGTNTKELLSDRGSTRFLH